MLFWLHTYSSLQSEVVCHDFVNFLMQILVFLVRFLVFFHVFLLYLLFFFFILFTQGVVLSKKLPLWRHFVLSTQSGLYSFWLVSCFLWLLSCNRTTVSWITHPLPLGLLSCFTGACPHITSSERVLAVQCFWAFVCFKMYFLPLWLIYS